MFTTNKPDYDVIIAGSGFGGSFAAYALAQAGFKTLLVERGSWAKRDETDWDAQEILANKRYKSASPLFVKQCNDKGFKKTHANEVVGGGSVFYGGASLRMREMDFEAWPIDYLDLEPYYTLAEDLLEVHGESGKDPYDPHRSGDFLLENIPLTTPAQRIYTAASRLGYKPFKIPMAINFRNKSRPLCIKCNTCDGFPCKIEAKNDLAVTVLSKALDFGAEIMTGVIVKKVVEKNGAIQSIECIDKDTRESYCLSSKVVIISGGAIQSPALLLRSNLQKYEHHRFIGKYLMRHCNAVVCSVFPFRTNPEKVFHKQVCITAFYEDLREQLNTCTGVIQDIYTPPREAIEHFAPRRIKRAVGAVSEYMQNLLCIAEDDPSFNNGITLSDELDAYGLPAIKVEHQYSANDYLRRNYLIKRAKKILRKSGALGHYIYGVDTLSHAIGTLRFGTSPETSVLDKNCRFFGIKNLFVLDGSFMPTSAGVNPSMTIAANSLRVADHIISDFDRITGHDQVYVEVLPTILDARKINLRQPHLAGAIS
jgi:choline dehydrogenase-like flavoprotein